jgi:hypothetical protein
MKFLMDVQLPGTLAPPEMSVLDPWQRERGVKISGCLR